MAYYDNGINAINNYANDPMFLAALGAYNPNFMGTQAAQSAQAAQGVTTPQTTTTTTSALPKADYSEGSDSNTGLIAGLGVVATGAAALIADQTLNKGRCRKKILDFFKGKASQVADSVKSNRAMKEFRFKAKDGSQIFVKDGKVINIIEKGANKEIKGAKEIQKLLTDKGINQADLLDYKKLEDVVFKEYSFKTTYNGKTILVENGKIAKIEGVEPKDVVTELGGQDKYDNFMKNIVKIVEKGGTPKKHAPTTIDVKSYEWSQNGITGTAIKGKKGKYRLGDSVTQKGEQKTLSETERNAYLENHAELNTTVQSLIEKGHADGIRVARTTCFDQKGNKLYINNKGEIIGVELKDAIKDSAGINKTVIDARHDRTLLDSWLYNNPEAKELAKNEFNSGLARDGAATTFITS